MKIKKLADLIKCLSKIGIPFFNTLFPEYRRQLQYELKFYSAAPT